MALPGAQGPVDPSDPLTKSQGVSPAGPSQHGVESQQEGQKQFQLPTESAGPADRANEAARPSPMDVARDASQGQPRMTQQELSENIEHLQGTLKNISENLQNPETAAKMTGDHLDAMQQVIGKMNPDMRTIANHSQGEFSPAKMDKHDVLGSVVKWINGSQQTLGGAMNYLSTLKKPSLASFMKLQYSVQRASQRGELFASIIGASTSGIKTIMSTQLG